MELYSTSYLASKMGVCPQHVQRLIREGKILAPDGRLVGPHGHKGYAGYTAKRLDKVLKSWKPRKTNP